jgi:hypothetical protein
MSQAALGSSSAQVEVGTVPAAVVPTAPHPRSWACFSRCGLYRYALGRRWDSGAGIVMFVALNPSTADETRDDPTVRRCVRFARDWGFGGLVIRNLFAYRSTDPVALGTVPDPVGPENDSWLAYFRRSARLTVVAWGTRGGLFGRDAAVLSMLGNVCSLGRTKSGAPRHPLYLPSSTVPAPYDDPGGRLVSSTLRA